MRRPHDVPLSKQALAIIRDYAFEELVAELTSAYLCVHYEIKAEVRHASYLSHYLKMIKYDDTTFFRAAAAARRATDYLRALSQEMDEAE